MPTLTMSGTEDCQRRFQAAVDVIQSLPKNGSYRPSYEVMLHFYGLYKQAVCGPCTVSRPGFWDPVGRYKWDAWNQLGAMSRESAMAAYVDEIKKVAQEVIDTMPINEKTAPFFHYFEPLYHVIHDMPRPPEALITLRSECELESATQELAPQEQDLTETVPESEPHLESTELALSEGQGPTSDSESEIFCDSLEQLDSVKLAAMPDSFQIGHARSETPVVQEHHYTLVSQVTQMGAGHGGEGAKERHGSTLRRNAGREGQQQSWREPSGYAAHCYARWMERSASGAGSGGEGGDNSEGGPERLQDSQVQQQIVLALRQLREDMQSVMERLKVVEGLATANEKWWPFDISGRTLLLLLVWPFVTQGLLFLLRQRKRKLHMCI
ncbi:acyl-CoA-binding domain-containing protein 4-like isoform X2 [Myxocyprinus asiaticus]|uniref:acyl-CoA-binding domain-containing protein 4-like isoform X2 n=1 Tax=Myxocyprinus asiaticus TaxID=70543 RepID=UPI0022228D94|nr:acyl-CoA-binding domain-containing protein 4-like isoform X2 [Myxocyprinus asiaticus]